MAEIFDTTTNAYDTVWLGGDLGTFKTMATPSGGVTYDYGTLSNFSTLFTSSEITSGNVQFFVAAGNALTAGGNEVISTLSTAPATIANSAVQNGATALTTLIGNFNSIAGCNSVNPCGATSTTAAGYNAPITAIGAGTTTGTVGGAAVGFYDLVQLKTGLGNGTISPISNATGQGTWSVSATGDIQYTIAGGTAVPVPAAIWLLGSGILGLAGVGRRKKAA
jgi:hypothetical protein